MNKIRSIICRSKKNRLAKTVAIVIGSILLISILFFIYAPTPQTTAFNEQKTQYMNSIFMIPKSQFITELLNTALDQYFFYSDQCFGSDVLLPNSQDCLNTTNTSETFFAALPLLYLVDPSNEDINKISLNQTLLMMQKISIGTFAEKVISPLICSFIITQQKVFIECAAELGNKIVDILKMDTVTNDHSSHLSLIINQSQVYPVLASLYHYTRDEKYIEPINKLLNNFQKEKIIRISNYSYKNETTKRKYIPYNLLKDLYTASRIVPSINVEDIISNVYPVLDKKNPTKIVQFPTFNLYSVESCKLAIISKEKNNTHYQRLARKCRDFMLHSVVPIRIRGRAKQEKFVVDSRFKFEGEMLELFWQSNEIDEAKKFILRVLNFCRFGEYITGLQSSIPDSKVSDNTLYSEFFSRWMLNGILIGAGINYKDCVISSSGHLLKYNIKSE